MKITSIEARTFEIPVELPLLDTSFEVPITMVSIETDTGITGYGATGYLWPHATRTFINQEAAPVILEENPIATERIWNRLRKQLNLRDQTGVWSSGVSAIDIALWDIKGKHVGEPVWQLLGGSRNPVQAYVTFGHPAYSKNQLVEVASDLVAQGERRLKMVVGTGHEKQLEPVPDVSLDAERVRAVREAVGDDVMLLIDANYTLSIDEALDLCTRIEDLGITWFEEPVYGNDARLLATLRKKTDIPLAAGQNEGHRWRHRELITTGAIDISQPNVVWGGGYTECRKVAALAETYNLKIANGGGWPHHNMHLQAGMPNGWLVEFHALMWRVGESIYQNPPALEKGEVTLHDVPGLGLDPDWDVLDQHRLA